MEDGKVYYHDEMCQKISGNNIVGYKRNADSNVEYFNNSNKMMYVKIGDSSTTTTTTILALTTTVSGGATTSTTIPQLSYNNSLTATSSEIERGAIINYAAGYIQFVIPRTLAEEAYALDQSVKILKHHGEYIDVWNWNTARPGITPYIDGYYKIVGSNVYATNQIPLSVFTSNTTGAIFDAWDNPTKYDFGVSICGINGAQLPETINGGYIYNWIAKLSTNTAQWAIQTSNFGGSIYVANANFDISLLYSAGTTTSIAYASTSTTVTSVTSTTVAGATTSTVSGVTTTTIAPLGRLYIKGDFNNNEYTTYYQTYDMGEGVFQLDIFINPSTDLEIVNQLDFYISDETWSEYYGPSVDTGIILGEATASSLQSSYCFIVGITQEGIYRFTFNENLLTTKIEYLGSSTTTTSFDSTTSTEYASTTTTTLISNFSNAVDNQNISFITNEGINWIVDETSYYYGNSSIKNGDINDSSSSYIEATISGVEQISFYWKVSSESNYDYLNFYIDESLITRISGSVDWTQVSYDLDLGTHSIKWSYSKDGSVSSGDDCGWIDYIN